MGILSNFFKLIKPPKSFFTQEFSHQREIAHVLRLSAHEGQGVIHVTSSHANEEVAALGQAFENMHKSHLISRFMRHKPKLYLVDYTRELPNGYVRGAAILGRNIVIDTHSFSQLTAKQRELVIAHEVAHHLRLDAHARRTPWQKLMQGLTPEMELNAEQTAIAIVGGNAREAARNLNNATKALKIIHPEMARFDKALHTGTKAERAALLKKQPLAVSYTSPKELEAYIHEQGERMATPEGRSFVEQEITRRLEGRHNETFPNFGRGRGRPIAPRGPEK